MITMFARFGTGLIIIAKHYRKIGGRDQLLPTYKVAGYVKSGVQRAIVTNIRVN
jgi:hypothetical protein